MGASASVVEKEGGDTGGKPSLQRRLSNVKNVKMPRLKRAGTDDKNKFFGVTLQFGTEKEKIIVPGGCNVCNCKEKPDLTGVETSPDLHLTEYIQEEVKGVTNYVLNKRRSGNTARGAKYMGPWFHVEMSSEMPKSVKKLDPFYSDGKWIEPWHVTNWIKFEDPYTHVKARFRIWRRIERTALKPKPEGEEDVQQQPDTSLQQSAPAFEHSVPENDTGVSPNDPGLPQTIDPTPRQEDEKSS